MLAVGSDPLSELVLINGEEEFLKERAALEEARSSLSASVFRYSEPDGLGPYLEEAQLTPLSGEGRVFLLFDVSAVPELPSGDKDVLVCVAASKKKIKDLRAKRSHNFPKLKSFADNNDVIRWVLKEGDALNIDLSRVAGALFVSSGGSLRKISSEIRKLAALTPPKGIVSAETARSVLCFSAELTPKSVVDAICEGNPVKALAFYDRLQEGADETGWVIAFLQRHVLRQLRLASLRAEGLDSDRIAEQLGIHPFVFRKVHEPMLGLWSVGSLARSSGTLMDLDVLHKGGHVSARIGLELEIVRLSEEARENVEQRNGGRN